MRLVSPHPDEALAAQPLRPAVQLELDFDSRDDPHPDAPLSFRIGPQSSEEWHAHAVDLELRGELSSAIIAYRQALVAPHPDPDRVFDLAHALAENGQVTEAMERYRQVTELDPQYAAAWLNLGVLLADAGETSEAMAAFRRALAADPTSAAAHYNLADLLDEQHRATDARPHWDAYLRIASPFSRHAEYARGRVAVRG